MEEIDANYQELITVSKEVLRRKRATQQHYEELINQNNELQDWIRAMESKQSRLEKRTQALDGLTILAKAARKL